MDDVSTRCYACNAFPGESCAPDCEARRLAVAPARAAVDEPQIRAPIDRGDEVVFTRDLGKMQQLTLEGPQPSERSTTIRQETP